MTNNLHKRVVQPQQYTTQYVVTCAGRATKTINDSAAVWLLSSLPSYYVHQFKIQNEIKS